MNRLTDVPLLVTVPRFGRSTVSVDVDYSLDCPTFNVGDTVYEIEKVWLGDWDITALITGHAELEQAVLRYIQCYAEREPDPDLEEVMAEFMVPGDAA